MRLLRGRRRSFGAAAAILLSGLVFIAATRDDGVLAAPRRLLFDAYVKTFPRQRISAPVTIVAVDEASLAALGQWPWPRDRVAALIKAIGAHGPAAIGVDILFPEPDRFSRDAAEWSNAAPSHVQEWISARPSNDQQLGEAVAHFPVALGIAGLETSAAHEGDASHPLTPARESAHPAKNQLRNYGSLLRSLPVIDRAANGHGLLSVDPDSDGVVRRVYLVARMEDTLLPSLDLEMLRLAVGADWFTVAGPAITSVGTGDLTIPVQSNGSIWVHYGRHDPDRFVSASDVLAGKVDPALLAHKLVLVGVTGLGLVDQPATAIASRMPGVEVRAQILETVFDNTLLRRPSWAPALEAGLTLLFGALLVATVPALRPRYAPLPYVAGAVALTAVGAALFAGSRIFIDILSPALAGGGLFIGMLITTLAEADYQRQVYKRDLEIQREKEAKLAGELEAARRIQLGSLPDPRKITDSRQRIDLAALLEPAKQVGGDLYDLFKIGDHHLFFVVGDVSGKGVPASIFMALGKALYKSAALRRREHIAEIMTEANAEIARDNPEMMFITAVAALLDLRDGTLTYCNAGHDLPLVLAPGCSPRPLDGDGGPPLCVLDDMIYPEEVRRLEPGSAVVMYTDGVTEAMDPADLPYGGPRLVKLLTNLAPQTGAEAIISAIRDDVKLHCRGAEPSDDITILVVVWHGPGEPEVISR